MSSVSGILLAFGHQLGILSLVFVALLFVRHVLTPSRPTAFEAIAGALFGAAAIVAMMDPVTLRPGIIFDARSVIIAVSAPFAGPTATLVAGVLAGTYRWWLGGAGALPALVSLAAVSSISVGLALWLRRSKREARGSDLLLLAAAVSLANLAALLLLPWSVLPSVLSDLALPLILANFIGIGLLGTILRAEREHRHLLSSLARSEAQYRLLADNTVDMIVRADVSAKRLYVSPGSFNVLGYKPEALLGTNPRAFVHPDDADKLDMTLKRLGEGRIDRAQSVHRFRHRLGQWVWVEVNFQLVRDADRQPHEIISVIRDVSERKRLEEELSRLSQTDPLTDLLNRRGFDDRLRHEWARAQRTRQPLSVLMIDVDHFKAYNDALGHAEGDRCLARVAEGLRSKRRATDAVGRVGGEEFVVLLPDTDMEGAAIVAEAVRAAQEAQGIAHPHSSSGLVTISIGVTTARPDLSQDCTSLMRRADHALYQAKLLGRNRISVAPLRDTVDVGGR